MAYATAVESLRRAWRSQVPGRCMICGKPEGASWRLEIHEIERRSQARGRWADYSNYLLVCGYCHGVVISTMSHAEQLAYKAVRDLQHYDLEAWLRLRDPELRAPQRVMWADIAEYLEVKA